MIQYKCENCGAKLESPAELGGGEDQCPGCGAACQVPLSKAQKKAKAEQGRATKRAAAEATPKAISGNPAVWWNDALEKKNSPPAKGSRQSSGAVKHKADDPGVACMLPVLSWIIIVVYLIAAIDAFQRAGAVAGWDLLFKGVGGGLVLLALSSIISLLARIANMKPTTPNERKEQ